MFFKNLQLYRLPTPWNVGPDQLATMLRPQAFVPLVSNERQCQGWIAPRGASLVHDVAGQYLLTLATSKKLLPATVVRAEARRRAGELEQQQGFPVGRKALKELQEPVTDELLPRAFSTTAHIQVWIDPKHGWLAVNAASASAADAVIKLLFKAVDRMPLESLRVQRSPVAVMTGWLESDEAPAGFTIDQDATMQASGESKAQVGYKRHTLEADDMRRHIAAGKQCTRLAMTWNDRISFALTDGLALRAVKPLAVLTEGPAIYSDEDRFDNDFTLMAGEFAQLLADLVDALGGEATA